MKQEQFFPAEEPLVENLENLQGSLQQAVTDRTNDFQKLGIVRTPGSILVEGVPQTISTEFPITQNGVDPTRIDVGFGVAYSVVNERVLVAANTPYDNTVGFLNTINKTDSEGVRTPSSTGNQSIALPGPHPGNKYVWIDYLQAIDPSQYVADTDLGIRQYTRSIDGYQIQVTTTFTPPTSNSLYLGKVPTLLGGTVDVANIDLTGRTFSYQGPKTISVTTPLNNNTDNTVIYAAGTTVELNDHVKCKGSADIVPGNPHGVGIENIPGLQSLLSSLEPQNILYQKETQSDGIISAAGTALATSINAPEKRIEITTLGANESFYLAGNRFTSTSGVTPTTSTIWYVSFVPGGTPRPSHASNPYYIYIYKDINGLLAADAAFLGSVPTGAFVLATVIWNASVLSSLTDRRLFRTIQSADTTPHFRAGLAGHGPIVNQVVTYTYDLSNNVTSVAVTGDVPGTITYTYNGAGLITTAVSVFGNRTLTSTFTYVNPLDPASLLTSVTDTIS